ncbi:glutathione S-transferase family protein [Oceanicoccus sagamiensis]|uniref:Glutathione S-transferase n=1 Tax=Oceanicoccus sagamiensis TaxID=716816 RepID=A0A1X9N858_9GAMM|nr:glutathione S-transferase family protein [Oceanicoccus sagamiensis]ARN73284.1 glutathione S-transferase [Oceanicoccus sagamiensis]
MDFKKIKLYHYPATRSSRVKWALYETVGDNFEEEVVSLYEGEQYTPEYMQINPNHSVPALEITFANGDKKHMLESSAMVSFLAEAFPEKNLTPTAQFSSERADYHQMLMFAASPIDMMLWQIRVHEHVLGPDEKDQQTAQRYRHKFQTEVEPQLIKRLQAHDFICGNTFTAADIVMGHCVMWGKMYGMCEDEAFSSYLSHLSKRAAFLQAYADAGKFDPVPPKGAKPSGLFTG